MDEAQRAQQIVSDWATVHVVPEVQRFLQADYLANITINRIFGKVKVGKDSSGLVHVRFTNPLIADALDVAFGEKYELVRRPKEGRYFVLYLAARD